MNVNLIGRDSDTFWYSRSRALVSTSDEKQCVGVIFGATVDQLRSARKVDRCKDRRVCFLRLSGNDLEFHYFDVSDESGQLLLEMSLNDLEGQLDRVGTLWDLIFPCEHAIICRTISYTVPKDFRSVLFSTINRTEFLFDKIAGWFGMRPSVERKALRRLNSAFSYKSRLSETFLRSRSLTDLYSKPEGEKRFSEPLANVEKRFEAGGLATYEATAKAPNCMEFGRGVPKADPSRGDRIHAYVEGGDEYFRDFVLTETRDSQYNDSMHAEDTLSHIMAFRRSGLFRNDFAKKIYNVTLPSIQLKNAVEIGRDILIIPHAIFYRTPILSSFRRTFSLSFVCVPVTISEGPEIGDFHILSRKAHLDEIYSISSSLRKPNNLQAQGAALAGQFSVSSLISDILELPNDVSDLRDVVGAASVGVLHWINQRGSGRWFSREIAKRPDRVSETAYLASLESQFSSTLSLVELMSKSTAARPWEAWLKSNEDESIQDFVYKRLFYSDFVNPRSAYTTRGSVRLAEMLVGNRLRTDMNGMTFVDPSNEAKLILYPAEREEFPNFSILRWLGFSLYQDSAIACLQEMIREFNREIDQADDTLAVLDGREGMLQNFGELYDLDIRYSLYRDEYQNVRNLLNLDKDYHRLHERFSSVKEEVTIREQRLFNKILLSVAVSTIIFGVIQYAGSRLNWPSLVFAFASTVPLLLIAVLIFRLFDPVRMFFKSNRGDG
jgi:hypothetical protein